MTKLKRSLLFFFLVSTFTLGYSLNSSATTYTIGVSIDSEQTLAIVKLDESTITREFMASMMDLNLHFKFNFIQEQQIVYGARSKWKVTSINESATDGTSTGWGIYFAVWNWSNFLPIENDTYQYLFINDDPTNEVNSFLCASPVSTYLSELDHPNPHTLTDTTLTREITFLTYNFTFVYQWDSSTGFLNNFKIIYYGNTILEIAIPGLLFGYEIPIFLGIIGIIIVGIIIILRKMFKKDERS